jgi:hypothetical protein
VDVEAVEVVVLPAHHDLNDVVQLGQRRELTDEDPPPDHGADLKKANLELVYLLAGHECWLI